VRESPDAHRRRATAFGAAASDYHRYRPRRPHSLINDLVAGMTTALDVGAGTGIAAAQLGIREWMFLLWNPIHGGYVRPHRLRAIVPLGRRSRGYVVEQRVVTESLHYTTDAWLNMVFTYSNVLTLGSKTRSELRAALVRRIGADGVDAHNHAVTCIAN